LRSLRPCGLFSGVTVTAHGSSHDDLSRPRCTQGETTSTLVTLGTIAAPGSLVLFWTDTLVSRVIGAQPRITVKAAVTLRAGPMTVPDATPRATPALSPLVSGVVVIMLCPGAQVTSTFGTNPTAVG